MATNFKKQGSAARINAILVFESAAGQRLGPYSLRKFFGRGPEIPAG
jgi:hypothetical protein